MKKIEIIMPQFKRPDGESGPQPAPTTATGFDDLRKLTDAELRFRGLRAWGRPDPGEEADPIRFARHQGQDRADLSGRPGLWLFPGEWYDSIPEGYPIVGLCYDIEPFRKGKSNTGTRFGCLPYGILVPVTDEP